MTLPLPKTSVSKITASSEHDRPVPPEPKKRTNRKLSIISVEKDAELTFDVSHTTQKGANEDCKGMQPAKSMEKDFIKNETQLEGHVDKDDKVYENINKTVRVMEKEVDTKKVEDPLSSLARGNGIVDVDQNVSQPVDVLGPEVVLMSTQQGKPSEKANRVDMKKNLPGTGLKDAEDEMAGKQLQKFVRETLKEEKSKMKENEAVKSEETFKPPIRTKGKVTAGKEPLKCVLMETKDIIFQPQPTVQDSIEDYGQRDPVKQVSIEPEKEKTSAGQQSVEKSENVFENKVEFAPPKPPTRTKSKSKGAMEKQYSRDTELNQDHQHTNDDQSVKRSVESLEKEVKEKPKFERNHPITEDTDIFENYKQPVEVSEKDTCPKLSIKQPVKPIRKEPEQEMKMVVEPMRMEEEHILTKTAEDIPLLYISEDETFLEAFSEIPAPLSNNQPPDSFIVGSIQSSTLPPINISETAEPPQDAKPEADMSLEDEPHLQDAAVKIQAAFKGYKTRKDMRPVFKEVFKNQSADLHGTLTLMCIVEGQPTTVRWLKNSQQIGNDHRCCIKTTEDGICTIVIKNITLNDSGVYTCEAVNTFGVTSYNGNVTVLTPQQPVQKPVHPPLAAVTPLQLTQPKLDTLTILQTQTQTPSQIPTDTASYIESVNVSLWEAYNLTEQQDTPIRPQERRGSSLIAMSSSEYNMCIAWTSCKEA